MKKSRPGALLTVLAKTEDADRLTKTIFAETTTLGCATARGTAADAFAPLGNGGHNLGRGGIKIANMNGSVSNYAPEYEDCRALAEEQHVPLRTVMQEAIQQYLRTEQKTNV